MSHKDLSKKDFSINARETKNRPFGQFFVERVEGVEPSSLPWQGSIIAAIRYPHVYVKLLHLLNLLPKSTVQKPENPVQNVPRDYQTPAKDASIG